MKKESDQVEGFTLLLRFFFANRMRISEESRDPKRISAGND
ncbi:MAG: hypothetical protein ACLUJC_05085 [Clostridia bacterium]